MIEIVQNKNNKETISSKSQCHSLSNRTQYRKSMYVTLLENETTTDTVADSAATCHFFPNEEKEGKKNTIIELKEYIGHIWLFRLYIEEIKLF